VEPPAVSGEIVIPVDGSGLSLQAIPPAADFGRRLSGRLIFLHVATSGSDVARAAAVLKAAKRRSEEEGIPAETFIRQGDPAAEILKFSAERRAALIAMRTRLSLTEENGPLGSVTVRVLRAARVPMLIVRRPARVAIGRLPPAERPVKGRR
jgi:nucleotide-binding universal stress UspA family protein